jgi:hypothetical protein
LEEAFVLVQDDGEENGGGEARVATPGGRHAWKAAHEEKEERTAGRRRNHPSGGN